MTTNILSLLIIISALFLGSVEIWSITAVLMLVYTLGLFWAFRREYRDSETNGIEKLLLATWIVLIGYTLLQLAPLPSAILSFLSPSTFKMQTFYSVADKKFITISLHPYQTVMELLRMTAFFIVFSIVLFNGKDRKNLTTMIKILIIFGFVLAVFAIVQKATWNDKIYWFRELKLGGSPFGPFVNRNHFAGFIGMLIPLGLGLALTRQMKEKKMLYGFVTVIMAVALFFSLSRGGIIGFFSGIALFSILIIKSRIQTRKVWAVGIFLTVLSAYLFYLGIDPVIDRFYTTDITKEQRLTVWLSTLNGVKDFWLTGTGLGTFINVFPLYAPVEITQIYDHAHNDYLEFVLETGLIGFLLFIAFLILLLHAVKESSLHGRTGILRIAAVSSVFTMVVHSIFDFNLHILSNALLFSAILGMVVALAHTDEEERLTISQREKEEEDAEEEIELEEEIDSEKQVKVKDTAQSAKRKAQSVEKKAEDTAQGAKRTAQQQEEETEAEEKTTEKGKTDKQHPGLFDDNDSDVEPQTERDNRVE